MNQRMPRCKIAVGCFLCRKGSLAQLGEQLTYGKSRVRVPEDPVKIDKIKKEGEVMAGYDNIRDKGFNKRTTEELREITSAGGKASGEARRRKADFRKTLNLLLTTEIDSSEWTPLLKSMGLDSTLESAVNAAVIKEALDGNVKAYIAIRDTLGQTTKSQEDLEEQKIRTDRAKRARDQEVGDIGEENENINSFLKAINPTQEDIEKLFEEKEQNEETEKTSEV